MTRGEAIAAVYLAAVCLLYNKEPSEYLDKWFVFRGGQELITEEIAGLAYTIMCTAIKEVPTS